MTEQKKRGMKSLGAMLEIPKAGTMAPAVPAPAEPDSSAAAPAASRAEAPAVNEIAPSRAVRRADAVPATAKSDDELQEPMRPFERYSSFDDFERKDTRQRNEQIAWIETKRKQLNRLRAGTGERLTDNTLYRVAIDLLISRGDVLAGTTEAELRASLGLNDDDLV